MGFVADAIGAVAGAVGDVVEAVADNPILAVVAAVAAPELLATMAGEAAVGEGFAAVGAPSILGGGMTGAGMMTADMIGGTLVDSALMPSVLTGIGGVSAGVGGAGAVGSTGELGGSNLAGTGSVAPTGSLDVATAGGWDPSIANLTDIPSADQALNQAASGLGVDGSNVAVDNLSQNLASSISQQTGYGAVDGTIAQTEHAISLVDSGTPISQAVSTATNGVASANPFTQIANTVQGAWDTLTAPANNLLQSMSNTLFPGVDPSIAKFGTQTLVNTALNGGDPLKALEQTGIGTAANYIGSTVTSQTGSNVLGNASKAVAGGVLSGAPIPSILTNAGISAGATEAGNLTGSPTIANAVGTAGKIAAGADPTTALTGLATSTAMPYVNSIIPGGGINPTSALGILKDIGVASLTAPKATSPTQLTRAPTISNTTPQTSTLNALNMLPNTTPTNITGGLPTTNVASNLPAGVKAAPKTVAPSSLTPITGISGLTALLG